MSRCNVYTEVSNDNGRKVSIGGRGASDSVRIRINTDNAKQSDCALRVDAEVIGKGLRSVDRRKKGSDQRETRFVVTLPADPGGWTLDLIIPKGADKDAILRKVRLPPHGTSVRDALADAFISGSELAKD